MHGALSKDNETFFQPRFFILSGIPGMESVQFWIAFPLAAVYVITLLGNGAMVAITLPRETFHKPMYLLFSMLAIAEILISSSVTPKMLGGFWFQANEIGFNACLAQLFFVHASSIMATTILLAMAFDRYIAICYPLRYNSILTNSAITKIGILTIIRALVLMVPEPVLASRLSYCRTNIICHTYCEHMAVVKIACSNTTINRVYGLMVAMLVLPVDIFGILLSYCAILRAVFKLSSKAARLKALGTCGPHLCILLIAYLPPLFSFLAHRFGHNIPLHVQLTFANIYCLIPPLCNPIIYGARNKDFRSVIIVIFQKQVRM